MAKATVAAQTPTLDMSKLTIEQKRELLKSLREDVKDSKADEKGSIAKVKQDEDGTIWLGIKPGTSPGAVGSGNNAGQPYLFQADGITITLDGVNYKLGNVYAYKAKA